MRRDEVAKEVVALALLVSCDYCATAICISIWRCQVEQVGDHLYTENVCELQRHTWEAYFLV